MFPIGDSPNPRGIAWVTMVLIALNVAVYLLLLPQMSTQADPDDPRYAEYIQVIQTEIKLSPRDLASLTSSVTEYDLTVFEHGSRPAQWTWLSMLTSMFLHGGFMHLAGNMLFLWIYGNNPEFRMGRIWYLLAYLGTGFAASFGDILLRPDSNIPGVGASGAISGVLGMYFIWFPRNKVRLMIFFPPIIRQVEVGARLVLGFYIVAQNILPAILAGGGQGGGVAHGAHIGGFIGGVLVALLANWRVREWPASEHEPDDAPRPRTGAQPTPQSALGRFRHNLDEGHVSDASRQFFGARRQLAHEGLDAADAVRLGRALASKGEPQHALSAYKRGLALDPSDEIRASAHLGAARLLAGPLHQPTAAYQHIVAAVNAHPSDAVAAEANGLLEKIQPQVGSLPRRFV